jgi:DNA-directed RNA polymerase sigma subunit (sigma70/sigma32)
VEEIAEDIYLSVEDLKEILEKEDKQGLHLVPLDKPTDEDHDGEIIDLVPDESSEECSLSRCISTWWPGLFDQSGPFRHPNALSS